MRLPYRLHRRQPNWIPPLAGALDAFLSPGRNPYFQHAEARLFLAERDGEVVGRLLAHIDHNLNEFQGNKWGLFGFFEAENDPEVAKALFEAGEEWLGEAGRDKLVGPLEFSTNQVPGLLIEGYDRPPVAGQPWHPPYYRDLVEGCGLTKSVDTLWRELSLDRFSDSDWEMGAGWAARVQTRYEIGIRPIRDEAMGDDFEQYFELMRATMASHWGFVPLTEAEISGMTQVGARTLGPGMLLAERDGEMVAASVLVRDFNQCLAHMNGRLLPFGWAKLWYYGRKIDQARHGGMLIRPECQHLGVAPALFNRHLDQARRAGIKHVVIGWSLEGNQQVNLMAQRFGLEVTRRHRIYEKELG